MCTCALHARVFIILSNQSLCVVVQRNATHNAPRDGPTINSDCDEGKNNRSQNFQWKRSNGDIKARYEQKMVDTSDKCFGLWRRRFWLLPRNEKLAWLKMKDPGTRVFPLRASVFSVEDGWVQGWRCLFLGTKLVEVRDEVR
jgi:hypothetical protein